MDRLILLRHAKAERAAPSGDDFDRPLSTGGQVDAAAMGRMLAAAGVVPAVVLVSSALRTRQTWEAVQPALPEARARFEPALFHADAETVLGLAVRAGADGAVMVIGHNPGLHDLALRLAVEADDASELARIRRGFPPASAAAFVFDANGRAAGARLFLPDEEPRA